jgi:hypothetical protein
MHIKSPSLSVSRTVKHAAEAQRWFGSGATLPKRVVVVCSTFLSGSVRVSMTAHHPTSDSFVRVTKVCVGPVADIQESDGATAGLRLFTHEASVETF